MADQPQVANRSQKEAQTKHGKKRPRTPKDHPVDDRDDPDWEPGSSQQLRKKKAAAGVKREKRASRGELSYISSLDPVEKERRRLQHIFQQVSEEMIVIKLLKHLSSGSATDVLITSLGKLFDKKYYPGIERELSTRCRHCGDLYDPNYNNSESKNLCKLQHQVTRAYKDGGTTGWECDECGETWIREWGYSLNGGDIDEIGYCYEGPHDHSDPESG